MIIVNTKFDAGVLLCMIYLIRKPTFWYSVMILIHIVAQWFYFQLNNVKHQD